MTKILVTGGAGFVGGHTALLLKEAGYDVFVLDDFSNGHEEQLLGLPFIKGDIREREVLDAVFSARRFDAVLHFAALMEAGRSVREPAIFYDVNVNGTYALLAAMEDFGVKKLIFSSTAAVYGTPVQSMIEEDHPLAPVNPYGETKMICETLLNNAHRKWGLQYAALRYFNAAGSDPQGRIGERHDPETHLVPLAIDAAFGKRPPLQIFGNDYDTPDGTCIRDYIHVCDLARAHILALERIAERPVICNLGTGQGHSVMDVIQTVSDVIGARVPYEMAPRRAGDPPSLVCANTRARELLNWAPDYPDLKDMVKHAAGFRRQASVKG